MHFRLITATYALVIVVRKGHFLVSSPVRIAAYFTCSVPVKFHTASIYLPLIGCVNVTDCLECMCRATLILVRDRHQEVDLNCWRLDNCLSSRTCIVHKEGSYEHVEV